MLVLANVALGMGLVHLICGVVMFILVARLLLTYCTTSVAIVGKLLHVRYKDDCGKKSVAIGLSLLSPIF